MKANEKLVWGVLAGFALLIPIVLALVMDSPWYLLLTVALLAAVGALWFFLGGQWQGSSPSAPRPATREPEQAPEPLPQEVLTEIELPTTRPDYSMIFSARVNWQPIPQPPDEAPHADLPAVARHAVVERAAAFVGSRAPSDLVVARSALAALLGRMESDPTGQIRAQATDVHLDLREDDADRLRVEADRARAGWHGNRSRSTNGTSWTICKTTC